MAIRQARIAKKNVLFPSGEGGRLCPNSYQTYTSRLLSLYQRLGWLVKGIGVNNNRCCLFIPTFQFSSQNNGLGNLPHGLSHVHALTLDQLERIGF